MTERLNNKPIEKDDYHFVHCFLSVLYKDSWQGRDSFTEAAGREAMRITGTDVLGHLGVLKLFRLWGCPAE